MKTSLYSADSQNRIAPRPLLLGLIALYGVWQMGIVFYSGQSLSLFGRILTDIDSTVTTLIIAVGYVAAIVANIVFFKLAVIIGRVTLIVAFLSTVGIMLPLPQTAIAVLFYISAFCCVFMIGINYVLETALFDQESEKKFVFLGSAIIFTSIAILQGEWFTLPFVAFNSVSLVLLAAIISAYFLLPSKIEVKTLLVKDVIRQNAVPRTLTVGLYAAVFVSTVCLVFGNSFAESVPHGVGIYYLSGLVGVGGFALAVFKYKLSPFKVYSITFPLTAVGFVLAAVSINFPTVSYPAIILLGAIVLPANMIGLLSNTLFSFAPTRAHVPLVIACALLSVGIQAVLLSALRSNLVVLFSVLSVAAIAMLAFFPAVEMRLSYLLRSAQRTHIDTPPSPKKPGDTIVVDNDFDTDRQAAVSMPRSNDTHEVCVEETEEPPTHRTALAALSERENEMVAYVLKGYANSEIAKHMFLSEETVKTYRKRIYQKLDIHSRRELFALSEDAENFEL